MRKSLTQMNYTVKSIKSLFRATLRAKAWPLLHSFGLSKIGSFNQ
jgi:hypothetical protein